MTCCASCDRFGTSGEREREREREIFAKTSGVNTSGAPRIFILEKYSIHMYIHDIHHLLYDIYIYHILFFDIYIYLYRYLFKTVHLYIFLHFPSTFPSPLWDGPPGAGPTSSANSKVSLAGAVGNSKAPTSLVCRGKDPWFLRPRFSRGENKAPAKRELEKHWKKKHPTICGGFFSGAKELKN